MRRALIALIAVGIVVAGTSVPGAAGRSPTFTHLDPGGPASLTERVPVNIVFVGFGSREVRQQDLLDGLPETYRPIERFPGFYGLRSELGITYEYDYRIRYTDGEYEDRFFAHLASLSEPAALTSFQRDYNAQEQNRRVVRRNHHIDAPSVERWLAKHPPAGVNTKRNTVYYINWHGRDDFRFHVYTKTGEADPDTGYDFGRERDSRKLVAWGGTTANDEETGLGAVHRVWFYDFSAGPEAWGGNWNVDDADLDDDGAPDYRIPVIWEYGPRAYRSRGELTSDVAKLTRYVAIDLLFTTSPLYSVDLPPAKPVRTINLDSNTYEGWPGVSAGTTLIQEQLILDELGELTPTNRFSYDHQVLPFVDDAKRCYVGFREGRRCYGKLAFPFFANPYLQNSFQFRRVRDDRGKVDYELPLFNYAVGEGLEIRLLGYAEDNWRNGKQTFVFSFVSPETVASGYGLTVTMIHEVGHHLGLSHPHDGYDSEAGTNFSATGPFFFAWVGDESNTVMSYLDVNRDFSQFDRDNMARFETAAAIEQANSLAAEVLAADTGDLSLLQQADTEIGRAETEVRRHHYPAALRRAHRAYDLVAQAASNAGVEMRSEILPRIPDKPSPLAEALHQPGPFIDTPDQGPRNER